MNHGEDTMAAPLTTVTTDPAQGRRARRLRPPMHCYWGPTESCPRNGRITSLGTEGCFVKSKAEAADGQELFVKCWLPTERWLLLRARVTYHLPRIGFGLAFHELTEAQAELLSMVLEYFGEDTTE